MRNEVITVIYEEAEREIASTSTSERLQELKIKFLAKKSVLMSLLSELGKLPPEERKEFGQKLNEVRAKITSLFEQKEAEIRKIELQKKLASEEIDITLPGRNAEVGGQNPFYVVKDEIADIFLNMGFEVADGPEVETDLFNFEL